MENDVIQICYIFSGSGTRFPVFIGAIRALEEYYSRLDLEIEIQLLIGTSGGAMIAAGMASGYTSSYEMEEYCRTYFPKMMKTLKPSVYNLLFRYGFLNSDKILKELELNMPAKLGDTTIPVEIVTVNVDAKSSRNALGIYSTLDTPEVSLPRAVLASMSIPLILSPVEINGARHIDGGWLKNFAIDEATGNCQVIGFYFGTEAQKEKPLPWYRFFSRIFNYCNRLVDLSITQNMLEAIEDVEGKHVALYKLRTTAPGLNLNISQDDITKMIKEGYESMVKHLS